VIINVSDEANRTYAYYVTCRDIIASSWYEGRSPGNNLTLE